METKTSYDAVRRRRLARQKIAGLWLEQNEAELRDEHRDPEYWPEVREEILRSQGISAEEQE